MRVSLWAVAAFFVVAGAWQQALGAPSQIHLSWQGPTATTMTVSWRSSESSGSVRYGEATGYGQLAQATSVPYEGSYLHHAQIEGLSPDTRYHYSCGTEGAWSADATFQTAPLKGPFRFIALGDSRTDNVARTAVANAAAARSPRFVVHSGDLVDDGRKQSQWDTWFGAMQRLSTIAPIMTAVGNHEKNSPLYFEQFALPTHSPSSDYEDEAYYSFNYGNTHFVAVSTEPVGAVGGAQYKWLRNDLIAAAKDPEIRWVVVYAHRPAYSSGSHGSNLAVRKAWVHLFESLDVDVTFWGHDHCYERTKQLFQDKPVENGGVTYITSGGAGAPLYRVGKSDFTAFSQSIHHFVEVSVSDTEMKLQTTDKEGNVFDGVVLKKDGPKPTWVMDGGLDQGTTVLAQDGQLGLKQLHAAFDGRYLYVATSGSGAKGAGDRFVLVSTKRPETMVDAPWKKSGKVWAYETVLTMESDDGWSGWHSPDGKLDPGFTRASNPVGTVMEGRIDLLGRFGMIPQRVYLAAVAYGTGDGAALQEQLPAGDGDQSLGVSEWAEFALAPPTDASAVADAGGEVMDMCVASDAAASSCDKVDGKGSDGCAVASSGDLGLWGLLVALWWVGRSRRRCRLPS